MSSRGRIGETSSHFLSFLSHSADTGIPDLSVDSLTCVQYKCMSSIAKHCMHSYLCMGTEGHCSSQECDYKDAVEVLLHF